MINYQNYIDKHFSKELKLLIYLSQNNIGDNKSINLEDIDWDEFIQLVRKHRLVSHVLMHSGYLENNLPDSIYKKLKFVRKEQSKRALNYAVQAVRIYEKFKEYSIAHCFFKGPLLSLELYHDIGYRNFGDIDILVEQNDVEKAKQIIEDLGFDCFYPEIQFTEKQRRINYKLSHHYHFKHPNQDIDIELHWKLSNPASYFSKKANDIISNVQELNVSKFQLPYISKIDNLVYQAAHGAIHQWYRLFWLKDFSILIENSNELELNKAFSLANEMKLQNSFIQACVLSATIYNTSLPEFIIDKKVSSLIKTSLHSICTTDLGQKGIGGRIKFVFYRLKLKKEFKFYFELIYRLRTHLTDWELLKLPNSLFFLYYLLRPFLLVYKFLFKKNTI